MYILYIFFTLKWWVFPYRIVCKHTKAQYWGILQSNFKGSSKLFFGKLFSPNRFHKTLSKVYFWRIQYGYFVAMCLSLRKCLVPVRCPIYSESLYGRLKLWLSLPFGIIRDFQLRYFDIIEKLWNLRTKVGWRRGIQ